MRNALSSAGNTIPCVTWSLHRTKGADGRDDPVRLFRAKQLRSLKDETRLAVQAWRIASCHLSLSQALRAGLFRQISQVIAWRPTIPTLISANLNEWRCRGGLALSHHSSGLRLSGPSRRTFRLAPEAKA